MAGYATNVSVNNPTNQTMPNAGITSDLDMTQLIVMALLALDIATIGLLIQRRVQA